MADDFKKRKAAGQGSACRCQTCGSALMERVETDTPETGRESVD